MVQLFDEDYYTNNGQIGNRPALGWYKKLAKRYLNNVHVLDFGCGTGTLIQRLLPLGQVDGFETSVFALNKAKSRNPISNFYTQLEEMTVSGMFKRSSRCATQKLSLTITKTISLR